MRILFESPRQMSIMVALPAKDVVAEGGPPHSLHPFIIRGNSGTDNHVFLVIIQILCLGNIIHYGFILSLDDSNGKAETRCASEQSGFVAHSLELCTRDIGASAKQGDNANWHIESQGL